MDNKYLLSTWTAPCSCGRTHRLIILSDTSHAEQEAFSLYCENARRMRGISELTNSLIDRDLVDGFFADECLS